MRFRIFRVNRRRLLKRSYRFLRIALLEKVSKSEPCAFALLFRMRGWVEFGGRTEVSLGLGLVRRRQSQPQIQIGFEYVWLGLYRFLVCLNGIVIAALCVVEEAEVVPGGI